MNIEIVKYNPEWPDTFKVIKTELQAIFKELNPRVEHIGSTAVPNLSSKPVKDIAVGIDCVQDLDNTVEPMIKNHFIYFGMHNVSMPLRRVLMVTMEN